MGGTPAKAVDPVRDCSQQALGGRLGHLSCCCISGGVTPLPGTIAVPFGSASAPAHNCIGVLCMASSIIFGRCRCPTA